MMYVVQVAHDLDCLPDRMTPEDQMLPTGPPVAEQLILAQGTAAGQEEDQIR